MIRRVVVTATTRLPRRVSDRDARDGSPSRFSSSCGATSLSQSARMTRSRSSTVDWLSASYARRQENPCETCAPTTSPSPSGPSRWWPQERGSVVRSWRSARFRKLVFTTAMTPLSPVSPKRSMYGPYTGRPAASSTHPTTSPARNRRERRVPRSCASRDRGDRSGARVGKDWCDPLGSAPNPTRPSPPSLHPRPRPPTRFIATAVCSGATATRARVGLVLA